MKPAIKQLYIRFCVVLRNILTHPNCTAALTESLTSCVVSSRNEYYEPKVNKDISTEQTIAYAKAITFGLDGDMEEEDAFDIPLPKPAKDCAPLATLFYEFGDVVGLLIEHADVPDEVRNAVHNLCVEITNDANDYHPGHYIAWAKYFTPHCMSLLAGLSVHAPGQDEARRTADILLAENIELRFMFEQAQSREMAAMQTAKDFEEMSTELTRYAPAVEARRKDYDQLTEALITMVHLQTNYVKSRLDLVGFNEGDNGHFIDAFHAHLRTLTIDSLNWFDPRTLRKFYTEMRLWCDQFEFENQQNRKIAA